MTSPPHLDGTLDPTHPNATILWSSRHHTPAARANAQKGIARPSEHTVLLLLLGLLATLLLRASTLPLRAIDRTGVRHARGHIHHVHGPEIVGVGVERRALDVRVPSILFAFLLARPSPQI